MSKITTLKNKFVLLHDYGIYNDIIKVNVVNIGNSQAKFSIIVTKSANLTLTNLPPSEDYYEYGRLIGAGGRISYTVPVSVGESIWVFSDSDDLAVRSDSAYITGTPPGTTYTGSSSEVQW